MKEIEGLTIEDIGREGFRMYQQENGFRFGTDSVLLAWFASSMARRGKYDTKKIDVLELGSNCGAVSLCTAARLKNAYIDCVEIMESAYDVLKLNIEVNKLEERMKAINADLRELPLEVRSKQYDIVMFNPPFFRRDRGPATDTNASGEERLAARFQENGDLDDFVKTAAMRVIPSSGHVVIVMHGDGLNDVFRAFEANGLTMTRLMTVHPFEDKNACMILAAGKKGASRAELKILPPLFLNSRDPSNGDIIVPDRILSIYEEEHTDCFI